MQKRTTIALGKSIKMIARLRGGGSALPGLVVEKIDPDFIARTLSQLPRGTIVISGTNGKTTTTKMVVELLESQGLTVFSNRTGSNFTRGVAAALLDAVDAHGTLRADIAVLELDEAHAVHFVGSVKPRYCLLLNIMRDQLDRFGEIDTTAKMLETVAIATTETIVLNREDPRIVRIAEHAPSAHVAYFGLSDTTRSMFPNDDDLHASDTKKSHTYKSADVVLDAIDESSAAFLINGTPVKTHLSLRGIYNIYNATAALALVRAVLGSTLDQAKLIETLAHISPAFGRGEAISINGRNCELILVKNPAGFRLALSSFSPENTAIMIAINDNYADGRDMSWLWDVDFTSLRENGVLGISGNRAYDMALRLQYDEVEMAHVDPTLGRCLGHCLSHSPQKTLRIYCTYTAMLTLRRELSKITHVEKVLS